MKLCRGPICKGKHLERSSFGPNRSTRDGLQAWCRECQREAQRRWRAKTAKVVAHVKAQETPQAGTAIVLGVEFRGHRIRVVGTVENPEWVASDVCRVLGLSNTSEAISDLSSSERNIICTDTSSGRRRIITVTESGLYALISKSRKPEAVAVRDWMFGEVIPSVRRYGSYPPPQVMVREPGRPAETVVVTGHQDRLAPFFNRLDSIERCVVDGQERSDASHREIIARLERQEERLAKAPVTRVSFAKLVYDRCVCVVWSDYQGRCPCCLTTLIVNSDGQPLDNLRREHWFSRGNAAANSVWVVCDECNLKLGEPGGPQRQRRKSQFDTFQLYRHNRFGPVQIHTVIHPDQPRLF